MPLLPQKFHRTQEWSCRLFPAHYRAPLIVYFWQVSMRLNNSGIEIDNNGLVLPPKVAPTEVVIIPIRQQAEGVLETARAVQMAYSEMLYLPLPLIYPHRHALRTTLL